MAYSKVILNGDAIIDLTDDTVTANVLAPGYTATRNDGVEVEGNFTSDATATMYKILKDETAYVNGIKVTGIIPTTTSADVTVSNNIVSIPVGYFDSVASKTVGTAKAAATYNTSKSDQTITSGYYLTGNQTIKAVTTSNISAANIKTGVTVKVGDANDDDRIAGVTGTFTSDGTAVATDILNGKIAYVNGFKVTGSIDTKTSSNVTVSNNVVTIPKGYYNQEISKTVGTAKAATTYDVSTSNRTIAAGTYCTGALTFRGVTTSNVTAANIKNGVVVKVGDADSAGRIANVTGTYTSDATATAAKIISGYTAYAKGSKLTGSCTPSVAVGSGTTFTFPSSATSIAAKGWAEIGSLSAAKSSRVEPTAISGYTLAVRYQAASTWYIYALNGSSSAKTLSKNAVTVTVSPYEASY